MGLKGIVEAGIASIFAGCSTHPLDLIKVRMQLQGENHPTSAAIAGPPRIIPVTVGMRMIQHGGFKALFSSVSATMLRQTLNSTTRMGLYDVMKTKWTDPNTGIIPLWQKISAGLIAGGICIHELFTYLYKYMISL